MQITSEQLLREAQERAEAPIKAPRQRVQDLEELTEFQGRKRTEFEGRIRYSRDNIRGTVEIDGGRQRLFANLIQRGSSMLSGRLAKMSLRGMSSPAWI